MAGSILSILYDESQRIWRYRWLVVGVAVVLFGAAGTYIMRLPNVYEASAQIYVSKETPVAAAAHGVSLVGDNFGSAYFVQRTLLNDQYLKNIVLKINPLAKTMDRSALAGALSALRSKIRIDPDQGDGFLQIQYQDTDPVRARNIVQLLLDQFITANISRNQDDLNRAGQFLDQQIAFYGAKVRASDVQIADFRRKHPAVASTGGTQFIGDAAADVASARADYQAALANTKGGNSDDSEITAERGRLATLRLQYTDQYPDVVAAKRRLDALTAARAAEPQAASGESSSVKSARDRLNAAEARMHQAEQGPASSPLDAEWADMKKSNNILRGNYEELMSRREATHVSQAVYADKNSGKYQVTSPPTVPPIPTGPNRRLYLAMAAIVALGAGMAVAYLRAAINGIFMAPRELEEAFGLPVAGTVSLEKTWEAGTTARTGRYVTATVVFALILIAATSFLIATITSQAIHVPPVSIPIVP